MSRQTSPRDSLERNLVLYRWHQSVAGALFWVPTMVLFLAEQTSLSTAFKLQAVYYLSVVALEVPSGWLSDRHGRVIVVRIAALSWCLAHLLFAWAPGLGALIAAQMLLACGYASLSGSDVTLHFDTLEALGRADEFESREAHARQRLLAVAAASALIGGTVGLVDLRLPFVAAALAALVQVALAWRLHEPTPLEQPHPSPQSPSQRARSELRTTPLVWLAAVIASHVVAVHLVADLAGPYLVESGATGAELRDAAFATGVVTASGALVGAVSLRFIPRLRKRVGSVAVLLGATLVSVGILVAMLALRSGWLLPLLAMRGLPVAAIGVIAPALVGTHVVRNRRASYLSFTSLCGRLGFGAAIFTVGATTSSLSSALVLASIIASVLWMATAISRPSRLTGSDQSIEPSTQAVGQAQAHEHWHLHWGDLGHGHTDTRHLRHGMHRHVHDHLRTHSGADHGTLDRSDDGG